MRLCVLLYVAALGGCQTAALMPSAQDTVVPASNELNRLGRRQLAAGNFGLAERAFQEAVETNGDDASSWLGLAAAYDNLRRFDLADRAYQQAIRLDGETLAILNNRGYSLYLRGDRTRALAQFRRALSLFPGNPIILNNVTLLRTGEQPNHAAAP